MKHRLEHFLSPIAVLFVWTVAAAPAQAQPSLHLQYGSYSIGARSTALADAYSSEAVDVSAMYWNPAALSFLQRMFVLVDHSRNEDASNLHFVVAVPVRLDNNQIIAVGATSNPFSGSDSIGLPWNEYSFDIATARTIAYALSFGVRASLHYAKRTQASLWAGSCSVGLYYSPEPQISYAFSYHGIGLGGSFQEEGNSLAAGWEQLPGRFEIGLTMRYPSSRKERFLTLSLANEKFIGQRGLAYKGGLELFPWSFLALRAGYQAGPLLSGMRYGFGVPTEALQVSYAYAPHTVQGPIHQLSLMFDFWD